MVYCLSDNIISPLGTSTLENYSAIKSGHTALMQYTQRWDIPDSFMASLFSEQQSKSLFVPGLSRFESIALNSAKKALAETKINVASERTVFILSTTKANVELLGHEQASEENINPGIVAERIATRLGVVTPSIVVCNACISGVSALVLAYRLLEAGTYDYAIVCGADVQCKFTISGFSSLKALSPNECQPFDIERMGLNLGEAAATMVLSSKRENPLSDNVSWAIYNGAIRNDCFHVSSPSKNGEGATMALQSVLDGVDVSDLALINAHGTATMFNDQMESVAIQRAGLSHVPVNGLKGYLGHTLGAAGIIETIITMASLDDGTILGTRGYKECGVSGKISIQSEKLNTEKRSFIKMISGFGGNNAAILVGDIKDIQKNEIRHFDEKKAKIEIVNSLRLTPTDLTINNESKEIKNTGIELLNWLYKTYMGDYPKYYKMDGLSRLGLISAELLLREENRERFVPCDDRAVILFNKSSSIVSDRKFLDTITGEDNYFPSPSVFIYTLPNMVSGEIAMRNKYHGETSFYITSERNDILILKVITSAFFDKATKSVIGGWIDFRNDNCFEADLYIAKLVN